VDVFVAQHDPEVAAFIRRVLQAHGHAVSIVRTGTRAFDLLSSGPIRDQIVLDAELPDIPGLELCRRLRDADVWTQLLVLVDRDARSVPISASGADGFLRRPFSGSELLAALDDEPAAVDGAADEDGRPRIDRPRRVLTRAGDEIHLSPTEMAVLELLVRRPGEVVPREDLLAHAWRYDHDHRSNVVEVFLKRLRAKVDRPYGTAWIETVRGSGYRWAGPAAVSSSSHARRGS
jgi:two-component system, OmpR family, response regulator